jgi:hypothetical protein
MDITDEANKGPVDTVLYMGNIHSAQDNALLEHPEHPGID